MFFLPKAKQNSSLSFSFYNLNITGDYRHLSFPFYSNASLPRLIQVILYYSSIPHPGPSFPNPPELPTLIHFSQNRSCQTSSNESGQTSLCYSLTSGTGPAKLNLLPLVKICLLYLNIPHRSWTRGHGPAKLNLLPLVKICLLYLNIPHRLWTRGHGPAKLNLLPLFKICLLCLNELNLLLSCMFLVTDPMPIPHPGPSFPNPPELPNLIHFSQNRSCQTSSNESGQACFSIV